jgi:hypothetical protein
VAAPTLSRSLGAHEQTWEARQATDQRGDPRAHSRRKVLYFNVTENSTAQWTGQQIDISITIMIGELISPYRWTHRIRELCIHQTGVGGSNFPNSAACITTTND